jgi:phosphonoacetaldehyde hydrolase
MSHAWQRFFTGPIEAVICDWAGTTWDFGSVAPLLAFQRLFAAAGVPITLAEARAPMGAEKREHIRQILAMPRVATAWQAHHGKPADESVIERLYHDFVPVQIEAIRACATPIPGLLETVRWLQERGIRLGANTGYSREMLTPLAEIAASHGYCPDSSVCATDVPKGRPWPHMSLRNALDLGVSDVRACVKVDDTQPGIEEGLAAGMWTVAVAVSGNEVGLNLAQWQALEPAAREALRERAVRRFRQGGAHLIIDSIADLPQAIAHIERWLQDGRQPDSPGLTGVILPTATMAPPTLATSPSPPPA